MTGSRIFSLMISDGGRKSPRVTGLKEIQKLATKGKSTIARTSKKVGSSNRYANRFSRRAKAP